MDRRGAHLFKSKVEMVLRRSNTWGEKYTSDQATDIGGKLSSSGGFEKQEMDLCKEYITETSIVLDIGANIGLHSIYFSSLAKDGYILSV